MFCPKCGQTQASEDMRFCSRCGFQLAAVAGLLANEGAMIVQPFKPAKRLSRVGAKLLFFSIVLLPVFLGISILVDHPAPLLLSLLIGLMGVAQIAYKRLFGENLIPEGRNKGELNTAADYQLPPMVEFPSAGFTRRDTADFSAPRSVTERTTTLLEKDRELAGPESGRF